MHDPPLTGAVAASYVGAWMRSAAPGHRGLNASRLTADALAAARSTVARARLQLAATRAVTTHASVNVPRPRRRVGTTSRPARRVRASRAAAPGRPLEVR